MMGEGIPPVRRKKFDQLAALLLGKTGANSNVLQRACIIKKPQQQRADIALARLVPTKTGHNAIAVAFVFDLKHHPLVRLVDPCNGLRDHPIEAGALESAKPV